jgi:hypothetical protein
MFVAETHKERGITPWEQPGGFPLPERSARGRQAYQALLLFWGAVIRIPHTSASSYSRYVAFLPRSFPLFTVKFLI